MSDTTIEQIPGSEPAAETVAASDEQLVAMLVGRSQSEGPRSTTSEAGAAATAATQPGRRRC
jgi:hypothetical protein